jgi:hypothetical protein
MEDMIGQRILAIACGHEDLNDHGQLRRDMLMQTALDRDEDLASSPTLSRLETRVTRSDIVRLSRVLLELFIAKHTAPPKELILDIDASDIPLHGEQEKTEFHGYYDSYCYCTYIADGNCSAAYCATAGLTGRSIQRRLSVCW